MNATDSTQADIKTVVIVELSVWAVFTLLTFLMLLRLLFVLRGSTCRQQLEPNFKRILINIVVVQAIASSAQLFYAIPLYFVYDQRSLIRTIFNIRTRIVVLAFTFKCYLNLVLACNRYTAMAFPIMQKTIWTSSRLNKLLLAMWLCFVTSVTGFSIATCFLNDKIYIKVVFFTCPILSIIPTIVIYCRIVCILCKMKSRHSKNMIPTIAATVTTTMGAPLSLFIMLPISAEALYLGVPLLYAIQSNNKILFVGYFSAMRSRITNKNEDQISVELEEGHF